MRTASALRILLLALTLVAGSMSAGAMAAPPVSELAEAVLVDGPPLKAKIVSVDAHWQVTFETRSGERKVIPAADLCWWGAFAEPVQDTRVLLVDGSMLAADLAALNKERLVLDWNAGGTVKLPLEFVAGIVFHPSADPQRSDELRARLTQSSRTDGNRDKDWLILANGDDLTGEILACSDDALTVRTAAGEVHVRTDKIAAASFNPSLAAKPHLAEARAWVGLRDGSRLLVSAMESDGTKFRLTLAVMSVPPSATAATAPPATAPRIVVEGTEVVALQPLGGRTVYLSDLKPAGYQHIPFLNLAWPFHADRNVLGTQLRAGGRLYVKGLGMHSAARLTYDLAGPYRAFAAEVAIDDQTGGRGSAIVRVYTDDGSGHPQLKYDSPIIRGGAAPLPVSVDLAGAKRVSLLVDFADQGDVEAHVDWLNARLLK